LPICIKNHTIIGLDLFFNTIYNVKKEIVMETMEKLRKNGVFLNYNDIVHLCEKYRINELSIFGSSIRDDFTQNSDVDILVSFLNNSEISLFDIMDLEEEFSKLINREVDIVEKESLKNPIRKDRILSTREIIYAA
jgi:predicted nucleotidyltransferase